MLDDFSGIGLSEKEAWAGNGWKNIFCLAGMH